MKMCQRLISSSFKILITGLQTERITILKPNIRTAESNSYNTSVNEQQNW
jgi:hypothetical protein